MRFFLDKNNHNGELEHIPVKVMKIMKEQGEECCLPSVAYIQVCGVLRSPAKPGYVFFSPVLFEVLEMVFENFGLWLELLSVCCCYS